MILLGKHQRDSIPVDEVAKEKSPSTFAEKSTPRGRKEKEKGRGNNSFPQRVYDLEKKKT